MNNFIKKEKRSFKTFLKIFKEHEIKIHPKRKYIGIIFALWGWFLYAFSTILFQKSSLKSPIFVNFFFQFLAMFLVLFICCIFKNKNYLRCKEKKLIIIRAIIAILAYFAYFSARIWTNIVDNSLLFSTDALFVPVIMLIFLKEKISLLAWIGLIVGFIGICFTYSFDIKLHTLWGVLGGIIGLSSGIGLAIVVLLSSYMVTKDPPMRIACYEGLIGLIISGTLAIIFGWKTPSLQDMSLMIFSGLFFALALFLFLDAYYYTEAYILGSLSYSLSFFIIILGWVITQTFVNISTIIGSVLIIGGGLTVIISSYHFKIKSIIKKKYKKTP